MDPTIKKWLIFIGLVIFSLGLLFKSHSENQAKGRDEWIPLGIDLKGGMSYQLKVDGTVFDDKIESIKKNEDLQATEKEERIEAILAQKDEAPQQALEVVRRRIDLLGGTNPDLYLQGEEGQERLVVVLPGLDPGSDDEVRKTLTREAALQFRGVALDNDERIDKMFQDEDFPPGYIRAALSTPDAKGLIVDPDGPWANKATTTTKEAENLEQERRAAVRRHGAGGGDELMLEPRTDPDGTKFLQPAYIDRLVELTGKEVASARSDLDQATQQWVVNLDFNSDRFGDVTTEYAPGGARNNDQRVGRRLAAVLDGMLYSSPTINEPIFGTAQISGSFSQQEANELSLVLRAGSLPAPVEIISAEMKSASLGQDAIRSGMIAISIGAVAVVIFMLVYYRFAGIIVNLALLADVILLPLGLFLAAGFLSIFVFQASAGSMASSLLPVMTLPGIAGLVLTIGMAVDANVLIFERMREEQATGKRFSTSVKGGFEKAFSTIIDANVTTLIVAVILFYKGSGTIRGFAVTLTAGIIVSVYTALVFTRMCFDRLVKSGKIDKLKMMSITSGIDKTIDFVSKRKIAAIFSAVVIIGAWAVMFSKGDQNLAIDLKGGSSLTFNIAEVANRPSQTDIENALKEKGITEPVAQFKQALLPDNSTRPQVEIKSLPEQSEDIEGILSLAYPELQLELSEGTTFGGQVSGEMRNQGIWAIILAMIGIVIYVSFRFRFEFAMGAIAALVHDVLFTVGVFCLLGYQISLPIIAALLTIVGYSVNDTIVVFDRIREDWELKKNQDHIKVANQAINSTLSRTLLTSITTLLTVIALVVFSQGPIHDFGVALLIGVLVGTYSSIFVATPVMLAMHGDGTPDED